MSSSYQNDNPYHELEEESLVEREVSVDAEQEQDCLDQDGDSDDEIANTSNVDDPNKSSAYSRIKYGDFGSYMKNKRSKIQIQHSQFIQSSSSTSSSSSPPIFQNLVFYINGHTDPPLAELTRRILLHGGKVLPYLDGKLLITHIIAGSLTPKKVEEFKNYKVVSSDFILQCIEQGRRLDWREFRIGRGTGIRSVGKNGLTPSGVSNRDSQGSKESNHKLWGSKSSQRNLTGFTKKREGEGDAESGKGGSAKGKEKEIDSSSTRNLEPDAIGKERSKINLQDRVKIMGPPKLPASVSKPQQTSLKTTNDSSTNLTSKPNLNLNRTASSHMSTFESNEKNLKRDATSLNLVESKSASTSNNITSPSKPTSKDNTSPTKSILPSPQTPAKPKTKTNHRYSVNSSNALASSLLSSPTWRTSHTAVDSSFLTTYFGASRLHHLSIWKSQMKDLVSNVLRETGKEQGSKDLEKGMERVLFHVDFDSYFVNVGLRGRDELRDKPCVVCHVGGNVSGNGGGKSSTIATTASSSRISPKKMSRFSNSNSDLDMGLSSTSEIASCNYVARSYGINNGMSLGQARRTLADSLKGSQTSTSKPNQISIVTLPYDFPSYEKISIEFYRILLENSDAIEAVSIDEALIDVSFLLEDLRKIGLKVQSGEEVDLDSGSIEARFFRMMEESSGNQDVSKTSSSTSTIAFTLSKSIFNSKSSPAQVLAEVLRSEIKARTGCDASIGIGSNTSLARLATRKAKPNGSFHLTETAKIEVLNDLDVDDLHGVGLNTRIRIVSPIREERKLVCDASSSKAEC